MTPEAVVLRVSKLLMGGARWHSGLPRHILRVRQHFHLCNADLLRWRLVAFVDAALRNHWAGRSLGFELVHFELRNSAGVARMPACERDQLDHMQLPLVGFAM